MLEGKTAFVTGGSGAVGAAIVRVMAREGCRVAFTYKDGVDHAKQLEADLASGGAQVRAWPLDVLDAQAAARLAQTIEQEFGPVDVLVNNAGFAQVLPFAMIEETDWDRYGRRSGNERCQDCLAHCGYEASSMEYTFGSLGGLVRTAWSALTGRSPGSLEKPLVVPANRPIKPKPEPAGSRAH